MLPTITPGSRLYIDARGASGIDIGDIVVFNKNGKLICHRIVGRCRIWNKIYFLEKGDNPEQKTISIISGDRIVGRVIGIQTFDGKAVGLHNVFSKRAKNRFIVLSIIFTLSYYLKRFIFGGASNSFLSRVRSWFLEKYFCYIE